MLEREMKFYKRWCHVFVAVTIFTAGVAYYSHYTKVDPFCRWVEAKYQKIILSEGPDAGEVISESYPNPASDSDND